MTKKTKKKENEYSALKGFHRAVPIILVAVAIFVTLCYITHNTGKVGLFISDFLLGTFSVGGYFIPALLLLHAFFYPSDIKNKRRLISRIIFSFIILITISALTHAIAYYGEELTYSAADLYSNGKLSTGGGFIGGSLAYAIISLVDYLGLILIAITIFAIYIAYFLTGERSVVRKAIANTAYKLVTSLAEKEKAFKENKAKKQQLRIDREREADRKIREKKQARRAEILMAKEEELYDDDFFAVDNGLKELKIAELGINESRRDEDIEKNPTLQEKVHPRAARVEDEVITKPAKEAERDFSRNDYQRIKSYTVNQDDIVITQAPQSTERGVNFDYSFTPQNDSADSVFSSNFNPYDLAQNERLANKPSSRAAYPQENEGVTEFRAPERPVRTITEKEIQSARERATFEIKREEAINEPKEERTDFTPFSTPKQEFSAVYEKPESTEYQSAAASCEADTLKITRSLYTDEAASTREDNDDDTLCVFSEEPERESFVPVKPSENASVFSFESYSADSDEEDEDDDEDEIAQSAFDSEEDDDDASEEIEINPEDQNPDVIKYRNMYAFLREEDASNQAPASTDDFKAPTTFAEATETALEEDEEPEDNKEITDTYKEEHDVPFEFTPSQFTVQKKQPEPEVKKQAAPDYSSFKFPPIDILAKGKDSDDPTIEAEIQENGEKLIDALAQFNVRATVRSVDRGPRITRYEIVPARGVRVNSVISLFDDIALNLAAEGIRMEAPIPGKSAIGVEIPNKHPTTVMLRDLLESEEFRNESSKTFACVGKDVTGNPVFGDISKMPHVLVAGATGMGKSVCINSILISILYKARPDEVKFIMIDPKTVEFTMYNGIPHLLVPVVTDVKQAAGALMWAIDEMNRRYELMAKHEVRKLDSYNDIVRENPELGTPLPKIVIVIDELNDLMQQVRKPVEGLITNITQKARAAGIHMIIGTQRPSVDVITGVIKANVPSRISCKVTSFNDSKTILDQAGAEKLLDKGDMLYAPVGKPKPVRVQGAFVSDNEVERIMKFLKSNVKGNVYDEQALEDINRAAQKCSKGKDSGIDDGFDTESDGDEGAGYLNDKQFLEAADLAVKQGKISTSLIQRKIGVGYGKAAKFIDIMEELGIVSEPNGQKPRDVLVTRDEWREMLSRRSLDD